jgi:hypothetical protein
MPIRAPTDRGASTLALVCVERSFKRKIYFGFQMQVYSEATAC